MRKILLSAAAVSAFVTAIAVAPIAQAQPYGYGPGYGMMGGYGPGYMMRGYGYGPGMMGGYGYGPGYMMGGYGPGYGMMGAYGPGYNRDLNLSTDDVKNYLERMIQNPNLKVGDVKAKDADTIVADIVTKDKDALVQRLEFNRHSGFYQPEGQ